MCSTVGHCWPGFEMVSWECMACVLQALKVEFFYEVPFDEHLSKNVHNSFLK